MAQSVQHITFATLHSAGYLLRLNSNIQMEIILNILVFIFYHSFVVIVEYWNFCLLLQAALEKLETETEISANSSPTDCKLRLCSAENDSWQ